MISEFVIEIWTNINSIWNLKSSDRRLKLFFERGGIEIQLFGIEIDFFVMSRQGLNVKQIRDWGRNLKERFGNWTKFIFRIGIRLWELILRTCLTEWRTDLTLAFHQISENLQICVSNKIYNENDYFALLDKKNQGMHPIWTPVVVFSILHNGIRGISHIQYGVEAKLYSTHKKLTQISKQK